MTTERVKSTVDTRDKTDITVISWALAKMNADQSNKSLCHRLRFENLRSLHFSDYGYNFLDETFLKNAYEKIMNISFEHTMCVDGDTDFYPCDNMDIYPVKLLSSFENFDVWYPRSVSRPTDKIIISIPKRITEKTLAIINMDKTTYFLLLLSFTVFSVLFAISYAVYGTFKSRTRQGRCLELVKYSLVTAWNFTALLFIEPFPSLSILKLSERILVNSWLFALIFLSAIINCNLKSEFCKEDYLLYESEDEIEKYRVRPLFSKSETSFYDKFVSRHPWVSKYHPDDITHYVTMTTDILPLLTSTDVPTALILSENSIRTNNVFNSVFIEAGITYHVAKLQFEYNVYGVNKSLIADRELDEHLTRGFHIIFETKPLQPNELKGNFLAERVLWKPPVKTIAVIKLTDISQFFTAYIYGVLTASLILLLELITKFCI